MICHSCGYDTNGGDPEYYGPESKPFIELAIVERGPFFVGIPDNWPHGAPEVPAIKRGTPVKLYACPQCGTVKIEV